MKFELFIEFSVNVILKMSFFDIIEVQGPGE